MTFKNSSTIPDEQLRPLLDFASRGINTTRCEVRVKASSTGRFQGRFQHWGPPPPTLITLHLPERIELYPTRFFNGYRLKRLAARFPDVFPFDDWRDAVVYLAAHEFRHLWQWRRRARRIERGKRSPAGKGEYDAELFALRRLNRYRVHTGRHPIPEAKQMNPFTQRRMNLRGRID